jgi:hypothetical protein
LLTWFFSVVVYGSIFSSGGTSACAQTCRTVGEERPVGHAIVDAGRIGVIGHRGIDREFLVALHHDRVVEKAGNGNIEFTPQLGIAALKAPGRYKADIRKDERVAILDDRALFYVGEGDLLQVVVGVLVFKYIALVQVGGDNDSVPEVIGRAFYVLEYRVALTVSGQCDRRQTEGALVQNENAHVPFKDNAESAGRAIALLKSNDALVEEEDGPWSAVAGDMRRKTRRTDHSELHVGTDGLSQKACGGKE